MSRWLRAEDSFERVFCGFASVDDDGPKKTERR